MKVELITHTPHPERTVACAARTCYSNLPVSQLNKNLSTDEIRRLIGIVISSGHHSVLEHATFTFAIDGISRACSHQLVRHRLATFSQRSQRYVNPTDDGNDFVIPESIRADKEAMIAYADAIDMAGSVYRCLIELGIPKEDARFVLPNAWTTSLTMTMNARELHHFLSMRCCHRAQWEIQELANRMLVILKETSPLLFENVGPGCITGGCPEGKMACGTPYDIDTVLAKYRNRKAGGPFTNHDLTSCPECGSGNIEGERPCDDSNDSVYQSVRCLDCHSSWDDIFSYQTSIMTSIPPED